jgi:hypothetical protein
VYALTIIETRRHHLQLFKKMLLRTTPMMGKFVENINSRGIILQANKILLFFVTLALLLGRKYLRIAKFCK